MANQFKKTFLAELIRRHGKIKKLDRSQSLYQIEGTSVRLYIRYSKVHTDRGNRMFYGLREEDLLQLEGCPSIICFLWNGQKDPLFIQFSEYEEIFYSSAPANDGQYKVQIFLKEDATELYIPKAGYFNVEGNLGWTELERIMDLSQSVPVPELTHSQVQTLLGAIGAYKGFDIWIPTSDRNSLDWNLVEYFNFCTALPSGFEQVKNILQEVDVVWIHRGSGKIRALFEVEHSTPIYSGLLRFNDIHLVAPELRPRYSVVSDDKRRSLYVKQLNRPTFQRSGLSELCTFLGYVNVFEWYNRIKTSGKIPQ